MTGKEWGHMECKEQITFSHLDRAVFFLSILEVGRGEACRGKDRHHRIPRTDLRIWRIKSEICEF